MKTTNNLFLTLICFAFRIRENSTEEIIMNHVKQIFNQALQDNQFPHFIHNLLLCLNVAEQLKQTDPTIHVNANLIFLTKTASFNHNDDLTLFFNSDLTTDALRNELEQINFFQAINSQDTLNNELQELAEQVSNEQEDFLYSSDKNNIFIFPVSYLSLLKSISTVSEKEYALNTLKTLFNDEIALFKHNPSILADWLSHNITTDQLHRFAAVVIQNCSPNENLMNHQTKNIIFKVFSDELLNIKK